LVAEENLRSTSQKLSPNASSAAVVSVEQPFFRVFLDENIDAFPAEEQMRLHRKKDHWLNQEDDLPDG